MSTPNTALIWQEILHSVQDTLQTKKLPVIVCYGATASGKTDLAIYLAQQLKGEIISADSRMVYEGMKIGTATPTQEEMQGITHHFIGHIKPPYIYTVKDFQKESTHLIDRLHSHNIIPIIAGGTNLFIDALVEGLSLAQYEIDRSIQDQVAQMSAEEQYNLLQKLDPDALSNISPNNPRHFTRKLEFCLTTGYKYSESTQQKHDKSYDFIPIGIQWSRETLYSRINRRVYVQIEQGLIEETKMLLNIYERNHPALTGLGYKQVIAYLDGEYDFEEMIIRLQRDTRRFAKRQLTWLRKKNILWFDFEPLSPK